ncbi:imm11 family protein [Leptospira stimsonii]|uniref:Immunity MXAN-0049 protein domain-containing protein n=1 Tax=Leptospira stimsonii TaxID=2202203 RepID=A0A396Z2L9_9LEPT|nr:DUF1629 domain-containing protein [Leptospira stimsonii]RHX89055.1 hypothetical protein DLM75_14415 [Leptospira stimsonii]
MNFYRLWPKNGFEWVNAVNPDDYEYFHELRGEPFAGEWKPIEVRRVKADENKPARISDFPWLGGHALILRDSAIRALSTFLLKDGELLSLVCDDGTPLYIFNSRLVDALNYDLSSVTYFPGTNRIMHLADVVLIEERLQTVDIFRLPHRASPTFVSQAVREAVVAADLKGLDFEECLVLNRS